MSRGEPALSLHVSTTGEPPGTTAIGARREVRRLLTELAGTDALDHVLLATSELINNALAYNEGHGEVRVWHPDGHGVLRVEVLDGGAELPVMPEVPTPSQLSGRGLNIVDTLADRWGSERRAGGKVVWFEMQVP